MPDKDPKPITTREQRSVMMMVGKYSSLAMLLPAAVFVGYVIGYFLDRWLGTGFLKMTFVILGVAGGTIEVIRQLQKES